MYMIASAGLGTQLRRLLAAVDGDVQNTYDALDAPFRPRFYPVVRRLQDGGTLGAVALADAAGVSQPAMTQTLGEMRRLGLIESTRGDDRRARAVALTSEGRVLARRLEPVWQAIHRAAAQLDAELPSPLSALLGEAIAALETRCFRDRIADQLAQKTPA